MYEYSGIAHCSETTTTTTTAWLGSSGGSRMMLRRPCQPACTCCILFCFVFCCCILGLVLPCCEAPKPDPGTGAAAKIRSHYGPPQLRRTPLVDSDFVRSSRARSKTGSEAMEWSSWIAEVGMQKHRRLLVVNHLEEEDIAHFNHDLLRSIGVESAKDRLLILKQKRKHIQRSKGRAKEVTKMTMEAQSAIIARLQKYHMNEAKLLRWLKETWPLCTRDVLNKKGYLWATAPVQGLAAITESDRTPTGVKLLSDAKDMMWAALYGDADANVHFKRVERELLVITVPEKKAFPFNFFQAVTEVDALGTWRDPDNISNDMDEPNMLLQVEYGETASEVVGDAVMVCIHVINLLEVNEQVLYARSSNVEQSTLLTELHFEKRSADMHS